MKQINSKISNKIRTIAVIIFIAIYLLVTYISLRGQYLEFAEIGEQYVAVFFKNIRYNHTCNRCYY